MLDGTFSLTDHDGNAVTQASYRGCFMLVYFGFTHCRKVCPRSLACMTAALDALGDADKRIVPLYITVDPERDTPAAMKAFLEANFPRFTGLTGSREAIDRAKASFRVFTRRGPDPEDEEGYAVPHTAFAYLFGPDGTYLTHFMDTADDAKMAGGLRDVLAKAGA
ncbi:MAG: SCO family protein [Parvibaculum sp.]